MICCVLKYLCKADRFSITRTKTFRRIEPCYVKKLRGTALNTKGKSIKGKFMLFIRLLKLPFLKGKHICNNLMETINHIAHGSGKYSRVENCLRATEGHHEENMANNRKRIEMSRLTSKS